MIPMTVEHPLLSLGGPVTTLVTNCLGPNQRVEIPDELTTATVLSNFRPLPSGTFLGVALQDGMDARGYVARLTRESGPDMARTALSIMRDAARIAVRRGFDRKAMMEGRGIGRYTPLPDVAGGWEFSVSRLVTPGDQSGVPHPLLAQELGFALLRNAEGRNLIFAMDPPHTSTCIFTVGYSSDKNSCQVLVKYDDEMGVAWTEGYGFRMGGEMLAGFRSSAGLEPSLSLQGIADRIMREILLSGQYGPEIVRKGVHCNRSGSRYALVTKATNPMRHSKGHEYMAQVLTRKSEKAEDAQLFVYLWQPCTQVSVKDHDSFWPLARGLVTLLWDRIVAFASSSYVAVNEPIRAN